MDGVDRVLFGRFPRDGGLPYRFTLFNADHYDRFKALNEGRRNLYCSIAWEVPFDAWYCDKVSLDLDTDCKVDGDLVHEAVPADADEYEALQTVRDDPEVAVDVLGDVVEDMNTVAEWAIETEVPALGVYTGYGVHVHLLYRPARDPRNQLLSTANYLNDELSLSTLDPKPIGDLARILRTPNCRRVVEFKGESVAADLWTVPLTRDEMATFGVGDLLALSGAPRSIDTDSLAIQQRPEMEIYDDYLVQTGYVAPRRTVDAPPPDFDTSGEVARLLEKLVKKPCVYERAMTHNPHHEIRAQFAISLFNCGFTVDEAHDLIRQLNWRDYDPEMTDRQLRSIWNGHYGDWGCRTLKGNGFCMRLDDPPNCPAYGWRGGICTY